jgi:hypothetical protein
MRRREHIQARALPVALVCLLPCLATAACELTADIAAARNTADPSLGKWSYTMTVVWETGSPYGLSHLTLWVDEANVGCTCSELMEALSWSDPLGSSTGTPGDCTVDYYGELNCDGDPSLGILGNVFKFEPYEAEGCEPGTAGTATLVFHSDFPPVGIGMVNLFLQDKHGQLACSGGVTGVFPGLPCDPTPASRGSWGLLKERYAD